MSTCLQRSAHEFNVIQPWNKGTSSNVAQNVQIWVSCNDPLLKSSGYELKTTIFCFILTCGWVGEVVEDLTHHSPCRAAMGILTGPSCWQYGKLCDPWIVQGVSVLDYQHVGFMWLNSVRLVVCRASLCCLIVAVDSLVIARHCSRVHGQTICAEFC